MLGAALRYRIGKLGEAGPPHQVDVLDLDIAARAVWRFEQEVDARVLAVLHLAADRGVTRKLGDFAGCDRLAGERIRMCRVDADKLRAAAEIDLDQLPAMAELTVRIVRPRQPHTRARRGKPD